MLLQSKCLDKNSSTSIFDDVGNAKKKIAQYDDGTCPTCMISFQEKENKKGE